MTQSQQAQHNHTQADTEQNADQVELDKFKSLASSWWDPNGPLKSLHDINPIRLSFIEKYAHLPKSNLLDIGCGGGILTEACAKRGALCTGVDANAALIKTARLHALDSELSINYRACTLEQFTPPTDQPLYDTIVCMELLEHVPDPAQLIQTMSKLLKPEGGKLFVSTINRNPIAYLKAVIAAEHILKLLPKGTHDYEKFIKPAELRTWCQAAGLELKAMAGMSYNPLTKRYFSTNNTSVNYLAYFEKTA